MSDQVLDAVSQVTAVVGVAARHLTTHRGYHYNADDVFFTASTFKVPLLFELYRQIDAGILSPETRIELEDELRVPGSGVLKEMNSGLSPTIHDLATLMIIVSDNVATDILYKLVGPANIETTIKKIGLKHTRVPMTCRSLLYSAVGLEESDLKTGNPIVAERLAHRQVVSDSDAYSESRSNVSTPSDMVRLLEAINLGTALSPRSRDGVIDILLKQQLNTIIPFFLPAGTKCAHKTGGVPGVRCDVGIVFSPAGPYAVAIMAKQVTDMLTIDASLARVSRSIYDMFQL